LSALARQRVLCLADEDNLRISLKAHGLCLSFDSLLRRLSATAMGVSPWAVVTSAVGDTRHASYLVGTGWRVVSVPREIVNTVNGPCLKANGDFDFCFLAATLVSKHRFDAVVIASGDGDLCVAIARGIRRLQSVPEIHTLSVVGSTSHRIRPVNNPYLFDGNILVGRDIARPAGSPDHKLDRGLVS
jgi:hypothetical protein